MAVFSLIAALDRIFGSRLGLGKEFEKGFMLLGTMALSMIGMIVIAPGIAQLLAPCFEFVYDGFGIDPSLIPAVFFANDMGGASIGTQIAKDTAIGRYHALVVSSMMGCTVSFTIPIPLGSVKKEKHRALLFGLLCGIVTIPVGCFAAGVMMGIPLGALFLNLLPLGLFSLIVAGGILRFPNACIRIFGGLGILIRGVITAGLALGILKYLMGIEVIKGLAEMEEGAAICLNAAVVMSGAFPMMFVLSKVLARPVKKLGQWLKINDTAALGFIASLATNVTTFQMMNDMDTKGTVLNSAFGVSAAFVFASHLAFTLAFDAACLPYVIAAKLLSGFSALAFAAFAYGKSGNAFKEQ